MNEFIFNDYGEFGLFLKINSEEVKDSTEDQEKKDKVDEYVKFFQAAKGGCPCNLEKRVAAAKNGYTTFVPFFFSDNESGIAAAKSLLGDATSVAFKANSTDEEPFFLI